MPRSLIVFQTGSQSSFHQRTSCITFGRIHTAVAPSFLQRLISSTAHFGLSGIDTHQRWRLPVAKSFAVQSFRARMTPYWKSQFWMSGRKRPSVGNHTEQSIPDRSMSMSRYW